jgi:hypothetical protein
MVDDTQPGAASTAICPWCSKSYTGDPENCPNCGATLTAGTDSGALAPPDLDVRREILRLELEAEVANLQAEADALMAEATVEGRLPEATPEDAAAAAQVVEQIEAVSAELTEVDAEIDAAPLGADEAAADAADAAADAAPPTTSDGESAAPA